MTSVYVLFEGEYSNRGVIGVYTSREKAVEAAGPTMDPKFWGTIDIIEYQLDPPPQEEWWFRAFAHPNPKNRGPMRAMDVTEFIKVAEESSTVDKDGHGVGDARTPGRAVELALQALEDA